MPRRREPLRRTINVRPVLSPSMMKWEGFHKRLSDGRAAPDPKGDRVRIGMSGKFLPYKYFGASQDTPPLGLKYLDQ
jgi:hypothetical protein